MALNFIQDVLGFKPSEPLSPEKQAQWDQIKQSGVEALRMLNPVRTDAPKVGSLRNPSSAQVKRGASLLPVYASTVTGATGSSDPTDYLSAKIMRSGRELVTPSNQTTATDRSAESGLRTFTQGTPGQDGYARMVVTPAQQGLRTAGTVQTPGGMTFSGTAADAQKFMEPVGRVDYNSPQYQAFVEYNRSKAAAQPELTQSVTSVVIPARPVFGGTGGWKTDIAKYQADTQAYNAAINEQGALARESLRAVAGQQPAPESQSQVALRNMQTKEAEARTGLLSEQTRAAAEQQKWVTLTEEVPTFDPASGTTVMKKKQYLYNPKTQEIARPGEAAGTGATQDAAAKRAAFAATYITKDLQKKWESMSDSEKDAAIEAVNKNVAKK